MVMASAMFSHLQNLWPFSILKIDDLKVSTRLVHRLSIPEQTKQFVFAFQEPDSHAVVYVLAAQNLSEQSSLDAEYLIKEVQPQAVLAQVAPSALTEIKAEENSSRDDQVNSVPTSSFGVLKGCFINKTNKAQYESLAGSQVLKEIFGVGFYGHCLAAKRAAEEVDSLFLLLESPYESSCAANSPGKAESGVESSGFQLQTSCLLPGKLTSAISGSSKRFCLTDTHQSQMVKSLTPSLDLVFSKASLQDSVSEPESGEFQPRYNYQVPPFAQSVYPLLADLHGIFIDLPAIGKALNHAQKMLSDVNEGEPVDTQLLSEVLYFRIAIEGLRIALNNAGRCPIDKMGSSNSSRLEFSELPSEEKCHVLFAQALRSQAKKFKSVVAIVDAGSLAGLRKHWNTSVPPEVADLADHCFNNFSDDNLDGDEELLMENVERRKLLADKPVVAVGAGATAVLGASSLSKLVPASTLVKVATFKVPASLKFGLAHLQRSAAIGLSKILGPSKLVAPGVASAGAKTSTLKATASAEKIRSVAHSLIASAQGTSLLAMRTSFYEIMRKRHVRPFRFTPWTTFGCSVAAGTGLLLYGDGIECAAELIPSVPMIASLGRGLQSLHQASQEVRQANSAKIHEAFQSFMYNLKKI